MHRTWRERLENAAGFFNGEGHTGTSSETRRDLYLSISQAADREPLDWFHDAVGLGRVVGPYDRSHRGREQPVFYYQVNRFEHVQAIVAMLWHGLSTTKRRQATAALLAMRLRDSHRRTCRRGHPRTPENIYRDKKHPTWRICRLCKLETLGRYQSRHPERRSAYEQSPQRRAYLAQWRRNNAWAKRVTRAALESLGWSA